MENSQFKQQVAQEQSKDQSEILHCKKCGAKKIIPADSTISAQDFLNIDSITLK